MPLGERVFLNEEEKEKHSLKKRHFTATSLTSVRNVADDMLLIITIAGDDFLGGVNINDSI